MTDQITSGTTARDEHRAGGFSLGAWVSASAVGLGVAYGLFALFGDGVEKWFGVAHDSVARDLVIMASLFIGAAVFATMRRRVLAPLLGGSVWAAVAAGISLVVGFVVGFIVAGPPFDFVLGVLTLGIVGGAFQWRLVKDQLPRPGRLYLAGIGAWFAAAVAVLAVAIFTGDAIFETLDPEEGSIVELVSFTAFLALLGLVGGAVGGTIEGLALRKRIRPPA
jgi:hypothetical protein